jgi:hypothetical protein
MYATRHRSLLLTASGLALGERPERVRDGLLAPQSASTARELASPMRAPQSRTGMGAASTTSIRRFVTPIGTLRWHIRFSRTHCGPHKGVNRR